MDLINNIKEADVRENDTKWSLEVLRVAHLMTQQAVARTLFDGEHIKLEQLLTTLKAQDG